MLTADLVRVFRRKGDLKLRAIDKKTQARALDIGEAYIDVLTHAIGDTRAEVNEALRGVTVGARDRKLADGLRKLLLDRCEIDADSDHDAAALRSEVFTEAAQWRREQRFDRGTLLAEVAERHGLQAEELGLLLYADLKSEHRLRSFEAPTKETLLAEYTLGQVQAVLLKAESVVFEVVCSDPAVYRTLFRKLKFHRLLYTIEAMETATKKSTGYRITVDGPFSMFSSVTKYGLQLALMVPAVRACDRWSLEAVVRWGKDRSRLRFQAEGKRSGELPPAALPKEVETLFEKQLARIEAKKTKWKVRRADRILSLPGVGVCVPDLVFEKDGNEVYLEVLGFWSRDAVWKRVELVEAGVETPIVFAVPGRLRVSEAVLPDDLPGALYVYKGVISIKAIEERLERLTE
ncbi:MAG: DUF790 family protein [Myxococcota bacterium]